MGAGSDGEGDDSETQISVSHQGRYRKNVTIATDETG